MFSGPCASSMQLVPHRDNGAPRLTPYRQRMHRRHAVVSEANNHDSSARSRSLGPAASHSHVSRHRLRASLAQVKQHTMRTPTPAIRARPTAVTGPSSSPASLLCCQRAASASENVCYAPRSARVSYACSAPRSASQNDERDPQPESKPVGGAREYGRSGANYCRLPRAFAR